MTLRVPAYRVFYPPELIAEAAHDTETILSSGQLVLGPFTLQFERCWAEMIGRRHGVACASDRDCLTADHTSLAANTLSGGIALQPASTGRQSGPAVSSEFRRLCKSPRIVPLASKAGRRRKGVTLPPVLAYAIQRPQWVWPNRRLS